MSSRGRRDAPSTYHLRRRLGAMITPAHRRAIGDQPEKPHSTLFLTHSRPRESSGIGRTAPTTRSDPAGENTAGRPIHYNRIGACEVCKKTGIPPNKTASLGPKRPHRVRTRAVAGGKTRRWRSGLGFGMPSRGLSSSPASAWPLRRCPSGRSAPPLDRPAPRCRPRSPPRP